MEGPPLAPPYTNLVKVKVLLFREAAKKFLHYEGRGGGGWIKGRAIKGKFFGWQSLGFLTGLLQYWVTKKLPQICTVILRIRIGKVA